MAVISALKEKRNQKRQSKKTMTRYNGLTNINI